MTGFVLSSKLGMGRFNVTDRTERGLYVISSDISPSVTVALEDLPFEAIMCTIEKRKLKMGEGGVFGTGNEEIPISIRIQTVKNPRFRGAVRFVYELRGK